MSINNLLGTKWLINKDIVFPPTSGYVRIVEANIHVETAGDFQRIVFNEEGGNTISVWDNEYMDATTLYTFDVPNYWISDEYRFWSFIGGSPADPGYSDPVFISWLEENATQIVDESISFLDKRGLSRVWSKIKEWLRDDVYYIVYDETSFSDVVGAINNNKRLIFKGSPNSIEIVNFTYSTLRDVFTDEILVVVIETPASANDAKEAIMHRYSISDSGWQSMQLNAVKGVKYKESQLIPDNNGIVEIPFDAYEVCVEDTEGSGNVVEIGAIKENGVQYKLYQFYYRTSSLPNATTGTYQFSNLLAGYTIKEFVDATGMTNNGIFIGNGRTDNTNRLIIQQFSKNNKTVTIRAYQDFSSQNALLKVIFIGNKNA